MTLVIRPISIREANNYVLQNHRHHTKKNGCRFAIACYDDGGELHGVAICSNPVARNSDDGLTLEIARVCTDGTKNACSILYGACARIAKEMGFRKVQTFILHSEPGTSLKAAGFELEKPDAGAENWQKCNSKRQNKRDTRPLQISIFGNEKKPPEELKQRWAKYFMKE